MKRTALITIASLLAVIASIFIFSFRQLADQKGSNEPQNTINTTVEPKDTAQIPETTPEVPKILESDLDTSTWKTYRNDEFGFEVKYPDIDRTEPGCETGRPEKCLWKSSFQKTLANSEGEGPYYITSFNGGTYGPGSGLRVTIFPGRDLQNALKAATRSQFSKTEFLRTEANMEFYEVGFDKQGDKQVESFYFKKDNNLFIVTGDQMYQERMKSFMSTFKFTK